MSIQPFLQKVLASPQYRRCVTTHRVLPERPARYGEADPPLPEHLRRALASMGIDGLYSHQATALELARKGADIVVVAETASGKSLCYNLPVLEAIAREPSACAIYIFPTKALSYDQQEALRRIRDAEPELADCVLPGVYDGDTPSYWRKKYRDRANILITNPDMLHVGIMPNHSRWSRLFGNLRFIVLDEIHSYRGIFGSNVANLLRRLERICDHFGARPQFICCSATINNPVELAQRLTGREVELVDNDGAPQSAKHFLIWNPPPVGADGTMRPQMQGQAERLITELVTSGIQTIAFTRTRMGAEVLSKNVKERLREKQAGLSDRVMPYRGGYLAQNRREIEKGLAQGRLLAVISTTALQLGVDIGSLKGCVIVGYPGTIAATRQQAGRAGRTQEESLVILVAGPDPVDQYIAHAPDYLFERSPENAVIDPNNPYILYQHVRCAAVERPLRAEDETYFGKSFRAIVKILEDCQNLKRIGDMWYWSSDEYPSAGAGLRTVSGERLAIEVWDAGRSGDVIGEIDAASVPFITYPEAVYIHEGETYLVTHLDLERRVVTVQKADVSYYTAPVVSYSIAVKDTLSEADGTGFRIGLCSANVTSQTIGYSKRRFSTGENLGAKELSLEPVVLDTVAAYITISQELRDALTSEGLPVIGGVVGLKNLIAVVAPLLAMCDRQDIEVMLDSSNLGQQAVFIFDRFDGGLGFAEKIAEGIEDVLEMCLSVVGRCQCDTGCPSCVGTASTEREALGLLSGFAQAPGKDAARRLLELMLGR